MCCLLRYLMGKSIEDYVILAHCAFKDYDGFDIANEDDDLEEFLGIPRKNPKVNTFSEL